MAMNKKIFFAVLAVGILVVVGLLAVLANNGAVGKNQAVDENLSQIKNRLKTRMDTLPPILAQVDSYKVYESSLLTNITELRSAWMNAFNNNGSIPQLSNNSSHLDQNLTFIVLTYEQYPELKADNLIKDYMGEVVSQNEQLAYWRGQYNGAVRDYNTFILSFPNNVFLGSGYSTRPYWGNELPDGQTLNS